MSYLGAGWWAPQREKSKEKTTTMLPWHGDSYILHGCKTGFAWTIGGLLAKQGIHGKHVLQQKWFQCAQLAEYAKDNSRSDSEQTHCPKLSSQRNFTEIHWIDNHFYTFDSALDKTLLTPKMPSRYGSYHPGTNWLLYNSVSLVSIHIVLHWNLRQISFLAKVQVWGISLSSCCLTLIANLITNVK